jgi:hypothetical protein
METSAGGCDPTRIPGAVSSENGALLSEELMQAQIDKGCTAIITDEPAILVELLER